MTAPNPTLDSPHQTKPPTTGADKGQVFSLRPLPGRKAPIIAVIGCDGSGKSTLTEWLYEQAAQRYPTALCHLGKQGGNLGRQVMAWPILGPLIKKKSHTERAKRKKGATASASVLLVTLGLLLRRFARFSKMKTHLAKGECIITDRFPQLNRPGPMDGPTFPKFTGDNLALRSLKRFEEHLYKFMLNTPPDIIIRLDIDLETALARKPDHDGERLACKIADLPHIKLQRPAALGGGSVPIVAIDGTLPLESVQASALKVLDAALASYGLSPAAPCRNRHP
ncbi:nucleoside triphosphate hydrolase [Formicincola oecophyllae]|uniref:Nucleoside triphosphate hydrolase n=1 Tax=Formicincola oecophyllae TaxID=2558361 RepID=A0A4Y6UAM0_9PROT|nr:nucleoside triphosphate hydrolase [Formicincola oecophyllae]QDH13506.2 nucleoside triphosphate hydrolase [Formicincola oecophyllae]